jgi:hypothetical protein
LWSEPQLATLGEVQHANKPMFRAFLLKEELRLLYHLEDPALAPAHLDTRCVVDQARSHERLTGRVEFGTKARGGS